MKRKSDENDDNDDNDYQDVVNSYSDNSVMKEKELKNKKRMTEEEGTNNNNNNNKNKNNKKKEKTKKKNKYINDKITINDLRKNWKNCLYYMKKKKRLCNMIRAQNCSYCPVHRSDVGVHGGDQYNSIDLLQHVVVSEKLNDYNNIVNDGEIGEKQDVGVCELLDDCCDKNDLLDELHVRVPCPIDSSHTVYQHKLQDHIKKCNTKTRYDQLEKHIYYKKDCNTGDNVVVVEEETDVVVVDPNELLRKIEHLYNNIEHEIILFNEMKLKDIVVNDENIVNHLCGNKSSYLKVRHGHQDVLLIKNMILAGLLNVSPVKNTESSNLSTNNDDKVTTYIELGAGKGLLGLAIASSQQGSIQETKSLTQLVMIERSGSKKTGDKTLESLNFSRYLRIRMDLRDCMLSKLPGVYDGILLMC